MPAALTAKGCEMREVDMARLVDLFWNHGWHGFSRMVDNFRLLGAWVD